MNSYFWALASFGCMVVVTMLEGIGVAFDYFGVKNQGWLFVSLTLAGAATLVSLVLCAAMVMNETWDVLP